MSADVNGEKIVRDFKVLLRDAEELVKATATQAGEAASTARERIERSLQEGKKSLADAEALLLDKTKEAGKLTEDYVRANPWESVGIAAGVGLLLGLLIRRS